MPHSSHHSITRVMEHVERLQPTTVLDIGVGYGKWGLLFREALDWMPGRHDKAQWHTTITGLEAFEGYRSPLYDWVYDEIIVGDITEFAVDAPAYDLVMMGDVLEHLTKDAGLAVLRTLLAKSRNVIVATPVDFFTQAALDNPFEQHHSLWRIEDFREWTFEYDVMCHTSVVACLAGAGATFPTDRERRLSEAAYRLPKMTHQGLGAQLIKRIGARIPSRNG